VRRKRRRRGGRGLALSLSFSPSHTLPLSLSPSSHTHTYTLILTLPLSNLTGVESREEGGVGLSVIKQYLACGGGLLVWLPTLFLFAGEQVGGWVAEGVERGEEGGGEGDGERGGWDGRVTHWSLSVYSCQPPSQVIPHLHSSSISSPTSIPLPSHPPPPHIIRLPHRSYASTRTGGSASGSPTASVSECPPAGSTWESTRSLPPLTASSPSCGTSPSGTCGERKRKREREREREINFTERMGVVAGGEVLRSPSLSGFPFTAGLSCRPSYPYSPFLHNLSPLSSSSASGQQWHCTTSSWITSWCCPRAFSTPTPQVRERGRRKRERE
jgi:hypothetical protein